MNLAALVDVGLVALLVMACALVAFRRLLPVVAQRVQSQLSRRLQQPKRARLLQRLGDRLQPAADAAAGCATARGCSACSGCASNVRTVEAGTVLRLDSPSQPRARLPSR